MEALLFQARISSALLLLSRPAKFHNDEKLLTRYARRAPSFLIQRNPPAGQRPKLITMSAWIIAMIIEQLGREHRTIEKLLDVLEHELEIFDHGDRPDYEVIRAVIAYFETYTELYHHPQEDLVFAMLKTRDPAAAARVGDLTNEHRRGAERLRRVAGAVDSVLADHDILRENVDAIVREFLRHERRHVQMEDREFFPAAQKALKPGDWSDIAISLSRGKDPLFSDATEKRFDGLRAHILELEREAEAERR